MISTGLRPHESASRPENSSITTLPAANTPSAVPANAPSRRSTSSTNSGTSDTRTPNTAQPLANDDPSAARYARCRSASRSVKSETSSSTRAASVEFRRNHHTISTATSNSAA
jgi:hypothetical protein